jgi:hypothetical protein
MPAITAQQILNLKRYPLDDLDSIEGQALLARVKQQLESDGSCVLPEFITERARQKMVRQALSLEDVSYPGPTSVTPYYFNYDVGKGLDVDNRHPTRRSGRRRLHQVAGDLIPADHHLSVLYFSNLIPNFLTRVLGENVYRNQDRFQSLNINIKDPGGCQQWHFDTAHMVTTLLLQGPERGGIFEYVPAIRSEENENFDEVKKVLDDKSDRVKKLVLKPGMLSLFKGRYSIHRVTDVEGNQKRVQSILGYTTNPELIGSIESSILHYGPRVAELNNQT